MKKFVFACDIDNTLIYSHKHEHGGWRCVEWIGEREQAYMSPATIDGLNEIMERAHFIPVTSRSVGQYRRIQWPTFAAPRFVITTHGAKLFVDGAEDASRTCDTEAVVAPWRHELRSLAATLADDAAFIRCRIVDEAYLMLYCAPCSDAGDIGRRLRERTCLTVCVHGKKIYLLPPGIDKGHALSCLRIRFPQCTIIAAGDSVMDPDMLNAADYALYPEALSQSVSTRGVACPQGLLFSEFVVKNVLNYLRS